MVRADPLKAQDSHSLEMSSRIGGQSGTEGAAPARRAEEQDTTPEPVSVKQDHDVRSLSRSRRTPPGGGAGPSAENFSAGGLEHQGKIDQFEAFISRLSMAEWTRASGEN